MSRLDAIIGESWGQRVVVLGTAALYAYLAVARPAVARVSAAHGLSTLVQLATLVVAALFLASAIGTLLPEDRLDGLLGQSARLRDIVAAGLVAGLLPGGPYATYPVIVSVQESGASVPAVLTMLTGYGLIGIGRVPFGLVFFSPRIVALRLAVAGAATVVVGVALFALGNALADRSAEAS